MTKGKWDVILIDDDVLVRMAWERGARDKGYSVLALSSGREFFAIASEIELSTPIYVDSKLSLNPVDEIGEEVTRQISALGFRKIFLATGYEARSFPPMPWLSGIVGKKAPWDL